MLVAKSVLEVISRDLKVYWQALNRLKQASQWKSTARAEYVQRVDKNNVTAPCQQSGARR